MENIRFTYGWGKVISQVFGASQEHNLQIGYQPTNEGNRCIRNVMREQPTLYAQNSPWGGSNGSHQNLVIMFMIKCVLYNYLLIVNFPRITLRPISWSFLTKLFFCRCIHNNFDSYYAINANDINHQLLWQALVCVLGNVNITSDIQVKTYDSCFMWIGIAGANASHTCCMALSISKSVI